MGPSAPRMTRPTQLVLHTFLEDPGQELYGIEVGATAGLPSGTLHPILARLEGLGWLQSRWEDVDPRVEGRPPRRYYRLTALGAQAGREALSGAYRRSGSGRLRPAAGPA